TYSCLPYGSIAYHLTVTLSSFANPLCCFVAIFFPLTNVYAVTGLAVYITAWASYILATALLSPNPPFVGLAVGATLVLSKVQHRAHVYGEAIASSNIIQQMTKVSIILSRKRNKDSNLQFDLTSLTTFSRFYSLAYHEPLPTSKHARKYNLISHLVELKST
ncbi:solute carrier family 52, riboflavin transporter, member 3-B, partial [Nephila pilipes]